MKAFDNLERLLECFIFSTETPQHDDDLIAHSKVRLKIVEVKVSISSYQYNVLARYCQHTVRLEVLTVASLKGGAQTLK